MKHRGRDDAEDSVRPVASTPRELGLRLRKRRDAAMPRRGRVDVPSRSTRHPRRRDPRRPTRHPRRRRDTRRPTRRLRRSGGSARAVVFLDVVILRSPLTPYVTRCCACFTTPRAARAPSGAMSQAPDWTFHCRTQFLDTPVLARDDEHRALRPRAGQRGTTRG